MKKCEKGCQNDDFCMKKSEKVVKMTTFAWKVSKSCQNYDFCVKKFEKVIKMTTFAWKNFQNNDFC